MSHQNGDGIAVVEAVVVRRSDFGWFCEIDGKRVFLATLQIAPGFVMPIDGTRGPIELTAAGFADLNLSRRHPERIPMAGPVTFPDVLVLYRTPTGWLCEVEDRPVLIAQPHIEPGTTMPGEGLRGSVTVTAEHVEAVRWAIRQPPA